MVIKINLKILFIIILTISLVGCSKEKEPLDPSKPITVTLWHYYNGHIKEKFDVLVEEFNGTIGIEKGIVVDAQSLGDVQQLADAVFDGANRAIGSQPLPDIFMAYPDNAYRVNQISDLVDLGTLFSEEELSRFKSDFLEEGRFGIESKLKILPIAKSTENLFVNKTFWDEFSENSGYNIENLKTWEGLVEVSKSYYESSGKGFLGIDSNANYMLLSAMQQGTEIYDLSDGKPQLNFSYDVAKNIWKYYYVPYINGYFEKNGRFSSDDAKTGSVIAYTGSTAGAAYFPTEVTIGESHIYNIEPLTIPYPYFENGEPYAIQQGAGMCVTKSDEAHQYGAAVFLKWFTEPKQNIDFAVSTGYFPVMNESLVKDLLLEQVEKSKIAGVAIPTMIDSTIYMFNNYRFYNNKPFEGSYELRVLLENNLSNKVSKDLKLLTKKIEDGESRELVIKDMIGDVEFEKWYNQFLKEGRLILGE